MKILSKPIYVLLLLCLTASRANAHWEPTYYLSGTIGKREVGVQIDHFIEAVYLKYFDLNKKKNIVFKGEIKDSVFVFKSSSLVGDEGQLMRLRHLSDESWSGVYVTQEDSLEVLLRPIDTTKVNHRYARAPFDLSPLGYLRTSDLQFETVRRKKIGGQKVSWVREKVSGVEGIRIEGKKGMSYDLLNQQLIAQHLHSVEDYFDCGTFGFRGTYQSEISVLFLNKNYLSYRYQIAAACFSEHHDVEVSYFNISILDGKLLELEDFVLIGGGAAAKPYSQKWFEYRREVFSPMVVSKLRAKYQKKMDDKEICDYNNTMAWVLPVWYLTKRGLYLGARFPGVKQDCNSVPWTVIPYQDLDGLFVGAEIR